MDCESDNVFVPTVTMPLKQTEVSMQDGGLRAPFRLDPPIAVAMNKTRFSTFREDG
jgi:hypothetical protein